MGKSDKYFLSGFIGGMVLEAVLFEVVFPSNEIPQTERVEQGYVIPNKLEIRVEDQDRNGEDETILTYDGQNYLLTLDSLGRPQIQEYEISPTRVVPR